MSPPGGSSGLGNSAGQPPLPVSQNTGSSFAAFLIFKFSYKIFNVCGYSLILVSFLMVFCFVLFFSVFFILKSQTAGTEQQFPAAAGSQAPRLLEVLGRCNSQGSPGHRQLRRSMLQREGVPEIQGRDAGDKHSLPLSWLPPKPPCLDPCSSPHCGQPACKVVLQPPLGAQILFHSPLLVPLPAPGPPLQACICSSVTLCMGTLPSTSTTTQHHVSKQLTQAWRVRSGEWRRE